MHILCITYVYLYMYLYMYTYACMHACMHVRISWCMLSGCKQLIAYRRVRAESHSVVSRTVHV